MKKLFSLLLVLALLLSAGGAALAEVSKDGKLMIEFWHTRGSGANNEVLVASVDEFNATIGEEKGIYVQEVFQGGYADVVTKVQLASQDNTTPVITISSSHRTALLMEDGLLANMYPYAEAAGFDFSIFVDSLINTPGNNVAAGEIHSLPYIRSTPLFYYNKTMADAKGLKAPRTIAEMIDFCKALHVVDEKGEVQTWGFCLLSDTCYYQGSLLSSMGAGLVELREDGTPYAACIEKGTLLKLYQDWKSWIDEGWCRPFDSAGFSVTDAFYQGKLAAFFQSSGSQANITRYSRENNIDLGVAYLPTYDIDNPKASIGGGVVSLVEGKSEAELQAGWEFIQFLMSDEQVAKNTIGSGYLLVTKTSAETQLMKDFWAENPDFLRSYEQLAWGICEETPYFVGRTEYKDNITITSSLLIQAQTVTPEEAVEQAWANSAHLFE